MNTQINSIADLNKQILEQLLYAKYKETTTNISEFTFTEIETAVMSKVFYIDIEYDGDTAMPNAFVGKFVRPEIPFDDMFRVEMNFYTDISSKKMSFRVPEMVYASLSFIMVQRVHSIEAFSVMQPCPDRFFDSIVTRLASMHARFWKYDCERLAAPAGIGSVLGGKEKEAQFPRMWRSFVEEGVALDETDRGRLTDVCERVEKMSLRELHERVHDDMDKWTMIHGDFHIGNMLFEEKEIWLVDWANCGRGNPMRDVVFFLIVSCHFWSQNIENNRRYVLKTLKLYHDTLCAELSHEFKSAFTFDDCRESYHLHVLNQFAILVCYDRFCREMASSDPSLMDHFRGVNTRCSYALLDSFRCLPVEM